MDPATLTSEWLWPNAMGVLPVAAAVWVICRVSRCRPSTRHALWVVVLVCFLVPPVLPRVRLPVMGAGTVVVGPAGEGRASDAGTGRVGVSGAGATDVVASEPARLLLDAKPGLVEGRGGAMVERPLELSVPALAAMGVQDRHEFRRAWPSVMEDPAMRLLGAPEAQLPRPEVRRVPTPMVATRPEATDVPAAAASPLLAAVTERNSVESERSDPAPDGAASVPGGVAMWRQWAAGLERIRQDVVSLPPLPGGVWLGGAAAIAVVTGLRVWRFQRLLSGAHAAPRDARRLVEGVAAELGLREPPLTLMTEARVSPLIWCVGTPRLVLPVGLWNELDQGGRRAVVLHELAHLRRRDHWVRWAELAAGLLFWWHPVVWWVRARIRDEADFACDAWVTALLPRERRAYAQALLCTQAYLNGASRTPPAVGLGVMSAAAQRLARRLTMVMKDRDKPGLSRWGAIVSLTLGAAGIAATPLWACPPEEKDGKKAKAAASAPVVYSVEPGVSVVVSPKAPKAAKAPKAVRGVVVAPASAEEAEAGAATTFEAHMHARTAPQGATMIAVPPAPPAPPAAAVAPTPPAPPALAVRAYAPARAGRPSPSVDGAGDGRLDELHQRLDRLERQIEQLLRGGGQGAQAAPAARTPMAAGRAAPGAGETIARTYTLPAGKLDALVTLMARQDVPIFISRGTNGITVNATAAQHEVFEQFIRMIHPEGGATGGGALNRSGAAGQQRALENTVLTASLAALAVEAEAAESAARELEAEAAVLEAQSEALEAQAEALQESMEGLGREEREGARRDLGELRKALRVAQNRLRSLEQEADRMSDHAERCRERAAECEAEHEAHAEHHKGDNPAKNKAPKQAD